MKEVLALTPDDPQALNYLGYSYAEMGTNLDEALKYLKKAVSLRPDDGFIQDSLGWVYYKLKHYENAILHLERAMELVDNDATVIEHLADAYFAKHDYRSALLLYRKALKLDPDRKSLAEKIVKSKAESGDK